MLANNEEVLRFWDKVRVTDGCWEWTAAKDRAGYGNFHIRTNDGNHRWSKAHRLAFEFVLHEIPAGLVIDHLCRNTSCVNPDHLEAVTQYVNTVVRGQTIPAANSRKTACIRGHAFTTENTATYRSKRWCRACDRERHRRYRTAAKERTGK